MAISLGTTFTNPDGTTTAPKTVSVIFIPSPNMDQRSPLKIQGRWQGRPALKPGVPVEMKPSDAKEIMQTVGTVFYAREDGSPIPRAEGVVGDAEEEPEPVVVATPIIAPVVVASPEPIASPSTLISIPNSTHIAHLNLELDLAKTHEKELELELALEPTEE